MNYGYARVSSKSQNLDRQIEELKMFGLSEAQLYVDCQSGKDFDRQAYRRLKEVLHPQDLLVIKSIDRLGQASGSPDCRVGYAFAGHPQPSG